MNLMMFKFDILPEPQKILWPTLCPVSKLGFVLYDDPEFDEFSRQDRDVIANACAVIDFEKIGNNTLKLTSQTLQDEKLWQTFQSLPKRNNATLPAGPLFPHHPV